MAKNTFLDWDTTAGNNTDIGGIGILGTSAVNNFDDAFRTAMAQLRSGVDGKVVYAAKSGNYTAVANDNAAWHRYTATATVSLTAAATLAANWHYFVQADGGVVTIDPNASETINGATTLVLRPGQSAAIICTGTAFFAVVTGGVTGPAVQGFIYGLTLSNNVSDATNDLDIAVGSAASDATTPVLMTLASALTKQLDVNWAAGNNAGMRYSGAAIANVTYHIYLAANATASIVDVYADPSPVPATALAHLQAEPGGSAYTQVRCIGSIRRDSATIRAFTQVGDDVTWGTPFFAFSQANPGTSALTVDTFTPTGRVFKAKVLPSVTNTAGLVGPVCLISPLTAADISPAATAMANVGSAASATGGQLIAAAYMEILTNTSSQIRARLSASDANVAIKIATFGYIDTRGRIG